MAESNGHMKTFLLAAALASALAGCAVVPYEPAPVVVAPAPPVVLVRPAYGYYGYYGPRHRYYWR